MEEFTKELYKELKAQAKAGDIKTVSKAYFAGSMGNGVTIAYAPMIPNCADCRMVAVSVSYCAPEDEFKKKLGKFQVYLKLYEGEFVQLPLGAFLRNMEREDFEEILLEMFAPAD